MTMDKLEQYRSLCRELRLWRGALDRRWGNVVTDTVRGSSPHFPYTAHSITITGNKLDREEARYRRRLERCEKLKQEIEDYIDGIGDSQLRQIIHCRYIEGYSWAKTAYVIGGGNTSDGVRMRVKRHLK